MTLFTKSIQSTQNEFYLRWNNYGNCNLNLKIIKYNKTKYLTPNQRDEHQKSKVQCFYYIPQKALKWTNLTSFVVVVFAYCLLQSKDGVQKT